ncbi:MAG: NAD(P)-dependent oxidoreductase [Syntrophales bacterium]|nr:NAD(P)-dependent oxidoreductase [Syntrophales bacterium]
MKTFVAEEMPELFRQIIKEKGWTDFFPEQPSDNVEIIIIRTKTVVDKLFLERFPKLKLLIRAGTGFDNIDIKEARKRNIQVCNTPDANALSAYEHTISFIFALLKQHRNAHQNLLQGKWKSGLNNNWEISDLKALIVGVGRVGTRVAQSLKYFGAEVKGVDPYLFESDWIERGILPIPYKEGLKWCNLISFHCPLTHETKNYFDETTLDILKNSSWLINTARGGIVLQSALKTGLEIGKLLGFAADVFSIEPPLKLEFSDFSNVILTPHIGSFTRKAKERLSEETLVVWKSFVFHNEILNPIENSFFL